MKNLNLRGADIGGSLLCKAKRGHRAKVGGNVKLRGAKILGGANFNGAYIKKNLNLEGADIGGDLCCTLAKLKDKDYWFAEIEKDDWLSVVENGYPTKVEGNMNLCGAKIVGQVDLNIELGKDKTLDLSFARVVKLEFKEPLPSKIKFEGCQFEELVLPEVKYNDEKDKYIAFLRSTKNEGFRKDIYLFMEKYLRNQGKDAEANRVFVAMRREDAKKLSTNLNIWQWRLIIKPWNRIQYCLTRYGTQTWILFLFVLIPMLVVTWVLFLPEEAMVPNPELCDANNKINCPVWNCLQDLWESLQIVFPILLIKAADWWLPSPAKISFCSSSLPRIVLATILTPLSYP